jgi:hypothetical protein
MIHTNHRLDSSFSLIIFISFSRGSNNPKPEHYFGLIIYGAKKNLEARQLVATGRQDPSWPPMNVPIGSVVLYVIITNGIMRSLPYTW